MFRTTFLFLITLSVGLSISSPAAAQLSLLFGKRQAIKTVSAQELRQLQLKAAAERQKRGTEATSPSPGFVVVDVRSAAEQAVSMIPGAITAEQFEKQRDQFQGQTVITYCTVGVRSEHYARKLAAAGQRVRNFKGSILAWCEEKYPLVTPAGEPTTRVHTYSSRYRVPSQYTAVY